MLLFVPKIVAPPVETSNLVVLAVQVEVQADEIKIELSAPSNYKAERIC